MQKLVCFKKLTATGPRTLNIWALREQNAMEKDLEFPDASSMGSLSKMREGRDGGREGEREHGEGSGGMISNQNCKRKE